jgi:hypothetical protein
MRLPHLSKRPRNATWLVYLRVAFTFASVFLFTPRLAAHWPPKSESDGVYGRFSGNTDLSLKLGGLISDSRLAGSVGASAHYYSLIGVTGDYSESLVADAAHTRSFSLGAELRPLFLPRWVLGLERGPAWLDLTLDSTSVGFGAYFADAGTEQEDARGVWLSFGVGAPVLGQAAGPWLELRLVRRFPDHDALGGEARNAMMFYLSWHHVMQVSQGD